MQSYVGIGVMSGSSTDGLDICHVKLTGDDSSDIWSHRINHTKTYTYSSTMAAKLRSANKCSGEQLAKLHVEFGHYIGLRIKEFIDEMDLDNVKFVAVRGHTVFHEPSTERRDEDDEPDDVEKSCEGRGYTFQLGDGETIATHMRCLVVTNFHSKDVALGGQGVPLASVGEKHLYHQYNCFLNLGGIASVSAEDKGFDACACNMLLNHLANLHDSSMDYDEDGQIAASGQVKQDLLKDLNALSFYSKSPPKSVRKTWIEDYVLPLLDLKVYKTEDLLATVVVHIAEQICLSLKNFIAVPDQGPVRLEKILLVTGGGALNKHLMKVIKEKVEEYSVEVTIVETDNQTIVYKEASIFAFLGLRTLLSLNTTNRGQTGAKRDAVTGSIHFPPSGASMSFSDLGQQSMSMTSRPRAQSYFTTAATGSLGLLGVGGGGGGGGRSNRLGATSFGANLGGNDGMLGLPRSKPALSKASMPARRKISAPPTMSYLSFNPQTQNK